MIGEGVYSQEIYNCLKYKHLCEFKVVKDEVLRITKEKGINTESPTFLTFIRSLPIYRYGEKGYEWVAEEKITKGNCEFYREVDIGLHTGEVSAVKDNAPFCKKS